MTRLRLVHAQPSTVDDRPRVSLKLLMAIDGRCTCDDCVRAYRDGDPEAGIIGGRHPRRLHSLR